MSNQVIIHKKSAVADKKPTTEQLQYGELAINTHDGKLYTKVDDGVERVINLASKPAVASDVPPANPEDGSLWFDTSDVSLNIYYDDGTSAQWISITDQILDLSNSSIGELFDIDITSNAPTNGQTLVWDGTKFVPGDSGTDLSTATTDDLSEGSTNLYYTDARVQTVIDTNTAGFITDYTVTQTDVTTHQAALSITESQISDLGTYATETYVDTAVSNLVDAAPETLDTLNELAAALGDDANFSTTVTNSIALKANSADLATVATSGDYNDLINTPAPAGTVEFGTTAPASPSAGDFWYNENIAELFVYDGTNWITTADGVGDFFTEKTTNDLVEGSTNKYYTDARVQTVIDANTAGFITSSSLPTAVSELTNDSGYITTYTVTQSDVTQHQAALSITESQISDLQSYLTAADITNLATETYVDTAVSNLVDAAPETLDTLNELAAALGDDANFSTTVTNSIALKANSADLATVATSGDYADLINTPTLFDGDYNSLSNTPTIPSVITDLGIVDGTNGQILSTDGSGNFTFIDVSSGASVEISNTAPVNPDIGSFWFDTTDATLNIYYDDGTSEQWIGLNETGSPSEGGASVSVAATEPSDPSEGDLWYDTTNVGLFVYNGTQWVESTTVSLSGFTADDLAEGSTNLYYTDAKVQAVINTNTAGFITSSSLPTAVSELTNDSGYITDYTVTEADVTAHQAALSITESQISNLQSYLTASDITNLATETYVDTAVSNLVDAAPTTLDTLNELAAALGDDPNFATTITNQIGLKADSSSLATVATSGDYSDLINTPTLFDGDYNSLSNTPTIPAVLTDLSITDGTNGQLLSTDGAGTFTFIDAPQTGALITASGTAPNSPSDGDLWYDTTDATLSIYYDDGTSAQWVVVADNEGASFSLSEFTADDLAEGSTNLYYTDAKVQAVIDTNTAGFITDYTVTEADVTTHQAALTITESQISDLGTYLTSSDLTGYATETYVDTAVSNLVDAAPTTLDTLNELAAALGDDANFSTTITNSLANKANTGDLSAVATSGDYADLSNTPTIPSAITDLGISDGTTGQVLSTDGAGNFTFADAASGVVISGTAPANPDVGSFWFDTTDATLNIYYDDGTSEQWIGLNETGSPSEAEGASVIISATAPSDPSEGDLWYDTTNVGLFIYIDDGNSAQWIETSNPPAGGGSGSVDLSSVSQSIIPDTDVTYDLGSPTNQWRDIYVGPGSLYVNGTKVIEDNAGTINVTADENQSIRVGTTGTGQTTIDSAAGVNITSSGSADITLTTATGQIELNGDVVVDVTKSITSSTGGAITFNAPISVGTNTITAQNFVGSFSGTIDDISNFTADDLAEGSTNLYYTDAKVQAVIDTNTAGFITTYTVTESDVTAHQAALSITESQISDLGTYATETYVDTAVANLVDTAPAALDTLNELAAALGDDANFATTVTNSLAAKVDDFTFTVTNNASGAYSFTGLGTGSDNPTLYLQRGMTYFFDVDSAGHPFRINTANTTGSGSEYTNGITNQGVETGVLEFTVPQDAPRVLYYNCEFHGAMAGTIYIIDETFDYNDLSNTPTLFDGDYNSLSNTPTIPAGLTDLGITDGTNGQVLATDGNGTFTFVDAATGQSGGGASVSVAETAPSSPSEGDLWFNSSSLELYIYYSNNWIGIDEPANVSSNGSSWLEASDNTILVADGQYLADSTSQAITLTLPASPSMGDEIRIIDAGGNAGTNNITVDRNGNNIAGLSENLVINIDEAAFGLVYFNATRGWVLTEK